MNFTHHNYLGDLELQKKETNGIRLYNLPDGQWVPSITSVTSFYNRQIFIDWRKRVGVEEANKITKKATARGTDYHEAAQNYLINLELNWDDYQIVLCCLMIICTTSSCFLCNLICFFNTNSLSPVNKDLSIIKRSH
jgi:hypothetical protein